MKFRIGVKPVMLEWSEASRKVTIRGVDGVVYLDIDASQIQGSELALNEYKLKVQNKWHILFYRASTVPVDTIAAVSTVGTSVMVASMGIETVLLKNNGIDSLQRMIAGSGGKADGVNFIRALTIGVFTFFGIIAGIIALVVFSAT